MSRPLLLLAVLFTAACGSQVDPNQPSLRDQAIERYNNVQCPVHERRMGIRQGKGEWQDWQGPSAFDTELSKNQLHGWSPLPRHVSSILGGERNWYFSCLSCVHEPDLWVDGPAKSNAPWEYWKDERCPVHDVRLLPAAVRSSDTGAKEFIRIESARSFPHAQSGIVKRLEIVVEGSQYGWAACCYKCEAARHEYWFNRLRSYGD